jgi:hypothetical protein
MRATPSCSETGSRSGVHRRRHACNLDHITASHSPDHRRQPGQTFIDPRVRLSKTAIRAGSAGRGPPFAPGRQGGVRHSRRVGGSGFAIQLDVAGPAENRIRPGCPRHWDGQLCEWTITPRMF